MGPPSEDGGNSAASPVVGLMSAGFNGAAVRRRRKSANGRTNIKDTYASMGPPSEDGGNDALLRWDATLVTASMGPPSEDGGNT